MKTLEELRKEHVAMLEKARELCDRAEKENRDFTTVERDLVTGYLDEAKKIKAQIQQQEGDSELSKALHGIEDQIGNPGPQTADPWSKAVPAGSRREVWSKAVIAHLRADPSGRKQLLAPSGAVGVPSLSAIIPVVGEKLETILQVIPIERTGNASVEYLREDTRTHAADTVAEGAEKPESEYELSEQVAEVTTIAHLSKPAPRQWFSDTGGRLQRYLDVVMRQGLQLALEEQVLLGSGVAPDLEGMLQVSGHLVQAFDTDILTTARKAITTQELLNTPTENLVFVMNPSDWETCELLEATDSGLYKLNGGANQLPVNRAQRRLWGVPVTLSTGLTQGTGVLFDRTAVQLYEREGVELTWSENTYNPETQLSDFQTNQIRWRAEGRWALAIYRPAGIVEIELEQGT